MSAERIVNWPGKSGRSYKHWVFPMGTTFVNKPGNYVYARESSPGRWSPLYIGQTGDLGSRLANHEKEACAKRLGATHIHAHTSGNETERLAEEADLISHWLPGCNDQGK